MQRRPPVPPSFISYSIMLQLSSPGIRKRMTTALFQLSYNFNPDCWQITFAKIKNFSGQELTLKRLYQKNKTLVNMIHTLQNYIYLQDYKK